MPKLSPESVLKIRADVRFRRVLNEAVVVRQHAAETLVVNEVAASVLENCDGSSPLSSIIERLLEEYAVDAATLAGDVYRFAEEMLESDLAELVVTP